MSNKLLKHISIIMDGNGRWAQQKSMPRAYGHRSGVKVITKIVRACSLRQISELTLFAFSSENWKRPNYEVDFLMSLFKKSIDEYISELDGNNIKIRFIGNYEGFSKTLIKRIDNAEKLTRANTGMTLNLAVNYGGRWDLLNAFKKLVEENNYKVDINSLTEENIEKYLSTYSNCPDLLIRTGGEYRLSNFLLWQHAYTELYFTECLWPDFDISDLDKAIKWFQERERTFGALTQSRPSKKSDV
ncbi:MAG: polyprenyl diphosphate synthase [Pseudomonadota bacterium]|nr:polyprenyl diphosphate synthase [Pseudomonadota bacterium]